jgi:hypothetical protein
MKIYIVIEIFGWYSGRFEKVLAAYRKREDALARISKEEGELQHLVAKKGPAWDLYQYRLEACELL